MEHASELPQICRASSHALKKGLCFTLNRVITCCLQPSIKLRKKDVSKNKRSLAPSEAQACTEVAPNMVWIQPAYRMQVC